MKSHQIWVSFFIYDRYHVHLLKNVIKFWPILMTHRRSITFTFTICDLELWLMKWPSWAQNLGAKLATFSQINKHCIYLNTCEECTIDKSWGNEFRTHMGISCPFGCALIPNVTYHRCHVGASRDQSMWLVSHATTKLVNDDFISLWYMGLRCVLNGYFLQLAPLMLGHETHVLGRKTKDGERPLHHLWYLVSHV